MDPENSKHQGETRQERLEQFVEWNKKMVLALREGTCLQVDGDKARIIGPLKAIIFTP